jgi:hypothetical protein
MNEFGKLPIRNNPLKISDNKVSQWYFLFQIQINLQKAMPLGEESMLHRVGE